MAGTIFNITSLFRWPAVVDGMEDADGKQYQYSWACGGLRLSGRAGPFTEYNFEVRGACLWVATPLQGDGGERSRRGPLIRGAEPQVLRCAQREIFAIHESLRPFSREKKKIKMSTTRSELNPEKHEFPAVRFPIRADNSPSRAA